ncbi:hypothetical protein B0T24DRAFT_627218 [Lasiosphaeria ovina]|uniref:Cytochrome b5 heme-binding domain-containing protein n=1 Tax=Lasiosphaeria ovina TaxID=92902 RepID=A0AAE0K7G5_9PEZI|nr:hypothetical protein B0T24DRAFT_627218 [Lasiosphaeria ovina]
MANDSSAVRRRTPEETALSKAPDAAGPVEPEDEKTTASKAAIKKSKPRPKAKIEDEDDYTPWLDVLRVITFLFFASCGLSYLISSGETFFWGMKESPNYMKMDWWKSQFRGPLYLTPAELAAFDGSDPSKPIYLAINGTIYDVSANARTYGPGGSYQYFAGCDASRAYVTGCFAEDRTPDMRGVEDMYLPLDDPAVDRHWTKAQLDELRAAEREEALRRVHEGLLHWVNFFASNKKYPFVGYVRRPDGWPGTEPVRRLCDVAASQRKPREIPGKETEGA